MSNRVLMDTCALIWFAAGDQRFSPKKVQIVQNAARSRRLLASVISLWEIGLLQQKGRLTLHGMNYVDFWTSLRDRLNLRILPITEPTVVRYHILDDQLHNDPADRFIAACTLNHSATLVTGDLKLLDWAARYAVKTVSLT